MKHKDEHKRGSIEKRFRFCTYLIIFTIVQFWNLQDLKQINKVPSCSLLLKPLGFNGPKFTPKS
jgi:hypothetical protein